MNDDFEFLEIYKANSCCKLAILKSKSGIEARCFVWQIEDKYYFDRIYSTLDWIETYMKQVLIAEGIIELRSLPFLKITLSKKSFSSFPYIDSFRFHHRGTNDFYYIGDESTSRLPKGNYRVFNRTDGSYSTTNI